MSDPIVPPKHAVKRGRYLVLPVVVFGVALLLPSMKVFSDVVPGYGMAWIAENLFFDASMEALRSLARGSLQGLTVEGWAGWPIHAGIWANHLFVLALALAFFRRWGMASAFAGIAAVCALICGLPGQFLSGDAEWSLWPGYFVWCAAPIVLAVSSFRAFRASRRGA